MREERYILERRSGKVGAIGGYREILGGVKGRGGSEKKYPPCRVKNNSVWNKK